MARENGGLLPQLSIGALPVSVNTAPAAPRRIVRVADRTIDYGRHMSRDGNEQAACRQFVSAQMNFATGADFHRGCPAPSERFEQLVRRAFVNSGSRIALAALSLAGSLTRRQRVHLIVDLLIGALGRDGDRAHNAVACLAFISSRFPAAIVELKLQQPAALHLRGRTASWNDSVDALPIIRSPSPCASGGTGIGTARELRVDAHTQQREKSKRDHNPRHVR